MTVHFDYTGQVAMITGASAGMGLAAARAFARAGAATALVDINETAVKAVTDELAGQGHQVLALVGDVSDETQVASVVAAVVSAYGRLDAAFNNAGIMMPPLKTADTDNATFDRVVAVNLAGVWNCLKHEILQMRTQQSGTIVNNSSIAGLRAVPLGRPIPRPSTPSSPSPSRRRWKKGAKASASTRCARAPSALPWSSG